MTLTRLIYTSYPAFPIRAGWLTGPLGEIGRAGRDGEASKAILFAGFGDMKTLTGFIEDSDAVDQFKQVQLAKLSRLWQW